MTRTPGCWRQRPAAWLRLPSRRRLPLVALLTIFMLAGGVAAATWLVGLDAGSSGQARAGAVSNLTITAAASPAPGNVLFPGGTGDVVVTISNPNNFPVLITALNLPANTTYATGYTDGALTTVKTGCDANTSLVGYSFATSTSNTNHALTAPLTVAASGQASNPLVVTLTNAATMGSASPNACQGAYFSLPSFTGITATAGGGAATTSPATSGWTS
jgi:hypothetical protein